MIDEELEQEIEEELTPLKALDELHCVAMGMKKYDDDTLNAEKIIEQKLNRLEKLETKYEDLRVDYYTECLENEFLEKALKIIVKKANIRLFVMKGSTEKGTRYYFKTTNNLYEISKEKYDLLKEVLLWVKR